MKNKKTISLILSGALMIAICSFQTPIHASTIDELENRIEQIQQENAQRQEKIEDLKDDLSQAVNELMPEADSLERVMIVGHGAMNKSIMCYIKDHGIDKFWSGGLQKNCNVIIVSYENGKFTVVDEEKIFY